MKTGIITFHAAYNYGSMLQAYALQTALQEMGHEAEIINFRGDYQKLMYRTPFSILQLRPILSDIKRIIKTHGKEFRKNKAKKGYEDFMTKYHNLTREISTREEFSELSSRYDVIITGSDQIWNQNTMDFSPLFFGEGAKPSVRIIAYAPSMGPEPEKQDKERLREYLRKYSAISVREERTKEFIVNSIGRKDVEVVLDPTMLLTREEYLPLIQRESSENKKKFAYYYTPGNHPSFIKIADNIAKRKELKLAVDTGYIIGEIPASDNYISLECLSPSGFLKMIEDADLIIGASFHLIVFAILFHKEFYCINGDVDSRMNNLLTMLGLTDRIVSVGKEIKPSARLIDWEKVDEILELNRNNSKEFLTMHLK